ncbi:hypothetical protein C241_10691 [Bradyrhizobium lupini HPC(L)]|uniref:Transmembrane protein n=1 Tax=Bradyrhizobium lupini HPC(L) TaxID=1229491 RepID=A0ABN0HMR4_RHILU|nr:hypothetical protein AWN88_09055 [Agrobacterium tumefaciens]EKJ95917.1 hypothetical protein C241_10691 [Bradyrhizobium lupini HPC(L)]KAJ36978.1 membrane protein [Agrobacterium tumefaciens]
MILGLTIPQFTALHVGLSFIGIATGLIALPAYAAGRWMPRMMALFLVTTLATTLTGFLFPIGNFTPALGVGVISTLVLAIALVALYGYGLNGRARIIYTITATMSLYLNMFVLIVQAFLKVETLNKLAPNGNEPPFLIAQTVLLVGAICLGWKAARRRLAV